MLVKRWIGANKRKMRQEVCRENIRRQLALAAAAKYDCNSVSL